MNRFGRRGQHQLTMHTSRTIPADFHTKIPKGNRAASCACGGEFVESTADKIERRYAEHILAVEAMGQGKQIHLDEAMVHVPVTHSDKIGWCEDGHRTVLPADNCNTCGKDFARTEKESTFRDTLIVPHDEWITMSEDERQRWAYEEGSRRVESWTAMMEEARNLSEPTLEETQAQLDQQAKQLEAQWYEVLAAKTRAEAEALTPIEG